MNESRFQTVVLLHDRGDSSEGQVNDLARVLAESHPTVHFIRPHVPAAEFNLVAIKLLPALKPSSLVVGLGFNGLYAIELQERFPNLDLSVFAINTPPEGEELTSERVVLYSDQYEPLRAFQPSQYSAAAFNVPWLSGGVHGALYATSYLISAYMRGLDMKKEVPAMLPQNQAQSKPAGI